jgi:integrase
LLDAAKIARPARCRACGRTDLAPDAEICGCGSPKIARRSIRIYDLRHGFATAALEAGTDVRTVADLMRHSSTRITQDVYQHVSSERKREAAERIAERLSQ